MRSSRSSFLERLEPRSMLAVLIPPSISASTVEIDDDLVVADGSWAVTASAGHVQVFGNSRGRIDGTAGQTDEDLLLAAQTSVIVTGAIGAGQPLDDLTISSATGQQVTLQQSVALTGDLRVTKAGAFTIGNTTTVGGDLIIDAATSVLFSGNVTVAGNLTISQASSVTFAGTLTVGGVLTIADVSGTTRFSGAASAAAAAVTSGTVQVQAEFSVSTGDAGFTANKINFSTATVSGGSGSTLVIRPREAGRAIAVGSPPGIASGLAITDADLAAIDAGWKRVVIGDEAAGTGAVRIGSIGSQYGGISQLLNTTTIVGGSIAVEQPVDVTTLADYLELHARTGGITVDAPINQTAEERNDWVRLRAAGAVSINKPVFARQTVTLATTAGGTITQSGGAAGGSAITAASLVVDADGTVTLADAGNAVSTIAVATTDDDVVFRDDSGYAIGEITTIDTARPSTASSTIAGIAAGAATVRLVTTGSTVTQTRGITAAELGLEGAGGTWTLSLATNDVDRLAADTGGVTLRDADDLTIGSVRAAAPQAALAGIRTSGAVAVTAATSVLVKQSIDGGATVDLAGATTVGVDAAITAGGAVAITAGTTATLSSVGDITSAAKTGTAVTLRAPSGITTAGDVTTHGGDALFSDAVTLSGDVAIDVVEGSATGAARFGAAVDGTTAGQESLAITGDLVTAASLGAATALESLAVSGAATLAGGTTVRTVGDQTYSGTATSVGSVTVRAGAGSKVRFLGATTLGGLVTTAAAYDVSLTGSTTTVADAVVFRNTGVVTLGDGGDSLTFNGGLTSTAPALTKLGGTIATSDDAVTLGTATLAAATTVSTGTGAITFSSTLDGAHALAANTAGATTFNAAVGGTTPLVSLTTDKGGTTAINGGAVTTSGATGQVFNDAVTLGVNTVLAAGTGAITFSSTLDGACRLDADTTGTTTFQDRVGGTTPLAHLETDAGGTTALNGGAVTTASATSQTYNDAVVLGANTVLDAGTGAITFNGTLDGGYALAVNTTGATAFNAAVGGTTPLASLATNAGGATAVNGGTVKTSGAAGQVYDDAVVLGATTVLDAVAGAITFAGTLDGAFALAVATAGTTTFNAAVGGTTPLASLATNAGGATAVNGGVVKTSGAAGQVYDDAVTLGANTVLNAGAGALTLASTVDGPYALTARTTGTTTFRGTVGGTRALTSLVTNAGGTTVLAGGQIWTSEPTGQTYNDAVTLLADTVLNAGAGAITLANTLDGGYAFTARTTGATAFRAAVGATTPLASLATNAGGATAVNGGAVRTVGTQRFDDAVTLDADTEFTGAGIAFGSTLQGPARTLTVTGGDAGVAFAGNVGTALQPLGAITVVTAGDVVIAGDVSSTGPVVIRSTDAALTMADGAVIDAGAGTILLRSLGTITLAGLTTTNGSSDAILVVSAAGAISDGGDVDTDVIARQPGAVVTLQAATGIGDGNPLEISAAAVTATTAAGGIGMAALGDLSIAAGGLGAPGPIDLTATGGILVPSGGAITGSRVTANRPIAWSVLAPSDSGPGSLRQVIANANATAVPGVVVFAGASNSFAPATPLPTITTRLTIDGSAAGVVIEGSGRVGTGLTLAAAAAGSVLKGVTLRNFTGFGIQILAAANVRIDGVTVSSLNTSTSMGLYATGDLSGTRVVSSTFSGGLRGALLDNARRLVFGEIGAGNLLTGNKAAPNSSFAGTGIRAQGDLSGTVVQGNSFRGNNYGFAFVAARGLQLVGNSFTRNSIAGIFVDGTCTGSRQSGNTFGTGPAKNGSDVVRTRGSTRL